MADDWSEHKRRIDAAVDIYAPAMSRYVNDRMIDVEGEEWYGVFLSQVVNNQKLKAGVRETYQKNLEQWETGKRDPSQDLEAGEFQWIVSSYSEKLPNEIGDLAPSLRAVAQKRNQARDNKRTLTPEDAEDAINACVRVLRTIEDEEAARNIEHLRNVDTSESTGDPADTRRSNHPRLTPPLPPVSAPDVSSPNHSSPPRQPGRASEQSGEQAILEEANVGALKDGADPSEAVQAIFKTYRRSMRVYIRATLQRKHFARTGSDGWFRELVLERDGKFDKKRMADQLEAGESPDAIMDVGNFRHIIQENRTYFHQPLGDGTCDSLFRRIEAARIEFPGHDKDDPYEREVEEVASACVTILELCRTRKTDAAADQIRRHFQGSDRQLQNDQSPSDGGSSEKDNLEPALPRDDRPEQGEEVRRREMDALSDRDLEVQGDLESAERERERRPFFGGVFARLWASEAAQSGLAGGGGAFVAGGEVDERELARGRRRLSVGRAILAVILVGLAVAIGFAVPGLMSSDGESTSEPATADPGEQANQQEPSAQTTPPAPEPSSEKNDPPVPPDDPDPEPIEQGEAKLPPPPAPVPPPEVPISFSAGAGHSCRLTDDGAAVCWGRNNHGQINVLDGRFTAISAGGAHTCGLRADGSAECWGWNEQRQIDAPGEEQFASIAAGWRHTCGITVSKAVKCWGWNEYRQSADRDGQFSQVSAGFYHTCAVRLDGGVECWGRPGHERTQPPAGSFATVSAGEDHTCGLRADDHRVKCWGGGAAGGSTSPPEGSFSAISAGQFHNCGILISGAVQCWGSNDYRQRDDVPVGDDFTQIDAGARHTCAMRTNGEVVCWGDNSEGQGNVDSAVTGDHIHQGSDPPPPPRPPCDFTDDKGNCLTDGEEGTSGSGGSGQTEVGDGQNGVGAGDDDPESDAMDDDDGSGLQPGALEEEEPGTTIVTTGDSHQAEPPGDGTIDPEGDAMDDDDGSGLQPGALQEEEPGTTIVIAEDNPIIVIPAQESADGDVMEDDE